MKHILRARAPGNRCNKREFFSAEDFANITRQKSRKAFLKNQGGNSMTEIRWHGRGGLGAFTAARLLGCAVSLYEGKYALAFPSFGPERRGAPVRAFTKLSSKPVLDRSETEKADYIIILDDTLYSDSLKNLLKSNGKIIVNSRKIADENIIAFDCDSIARELRLPTVNTILLGIFSAVSGAVSVKDIERSIDGYMPEKIREKNKQAVRKSTEEVLK